MGAAALILGSSMVAIGQRNTLCVVQESASGLYLDGKKLGNILLPKRYIPPGTAVGDKPDVFIYRDSEDRLVATTEVPHAMAGEFAYLKVLTASPRMGAFLDWGLSKDLLLPLREQARRVLAGEWVIAHVFVDPHTGRLVATTRLNRHLGLNKPAYAEGECVRLLIADETPLGYKAIVNNAHWGLLYHSNLGAPLRIGQTMKGYVRTVRADGKVDLTLDQAGYRRVASLTQQILDALEANGGRLDFDDQSSPEAIREAFGTSKKAFKQAIGALYREHKIRFANQGIEQVLKNASHQPPHHQYGSSRRPTSNR